MGPMESEIRCRCGLKSIEWVSYTEKNPGRRFLKCSNRAKPCRFWEWIDEPISPLVRSVMVGRAKKAEKRVKIMGFIVLICFAVILYLFFTNRVDDCVSSCNCCRYDSIGAIDM